MPFVVFERVPLPDVRTYIIVSIALHLGALYYAIQTTSDPDWKTSFGDVSRSNVTESGTFVLLDWNTLGLQNRVQDVIEFMFKDMFCLWVSINTAYCGLVMLGKMIQTAVFGALRPSEILNMREKFWNYILYKFIFIFGVIKVQYIDEVLVWITWFSILGFLQIFVKLARDRLNFLTTVSVHPSPWSHFKILTFLSLSFSLSVGFTVGAIYVGIHSNINVLAFMLAECFLLQIRIVYTMLKFATDRRNRNNIIYSNTIDRSARSAHQSNRTTAFSGIFGRTGEMTYVYYTLFSLELADLLVEIAHHLHMLIWGNIFLSMASLAIIMHLRLLFSDIQQKIKRHRTYLWVIKHMEKTYPVATYQELQQNSDNCAICWESMDSARKLPCGHLFHMICLQQWLEQDTSCPTCRHVLNLTTPQTGRIRQRRTRQHFFHFDGSRYFSWLPSFSVEVMHSSGRRTAVGNGGTVALNNRVHLEVMARQIQAVFPAVSFEAIVQNLQQTGSLDTTVDNILEGRLDNVGNNESFVRQLQISQYQRQQLRTTDSQQRRARPEIPPADVLDAEDKNDEPDQSDPPVFLSTSTDREKELRKRKQQLILQARRKYLSKSKTHQDECASS